MELWKVDDIMKLRKWVKVVLLLVFIYSFISLFTRKEIVKETGKDYTCVGSKLLQICSGKDYE